MKTLLIAATLLLAHDEGHGPKVGDQPKQGGVLTAVVEAKDAALGAKAALVYKAELVRLDDGTARVHVYDADMRPLDLGAFDKTAKAVLLTEWRKKLTKAPFTLELADGAFTGALPKAPRKPYNIDVTFTEGKRKLLAAFDNLD